MVTFKGGRCPYLALGLTRRTDNRARLQDGDQKKFKKKKKGTKNGE